MAKVSHPEERQQRKASDDVQQDAAAGQQEGMKDDVRALLSNRTALPGRRLIIGGGIGSTKGHCVVDILEVAWWLAQFSMSVNEAANPKQLKRCPPRNLIPGTTPGGPVFEIFQSYCLFDIGAAIFAFSEALAFVQLAVVHCSNSLNANALCGAGLDFLLGSMGGIAGMAGGIHLACDKFQGDLLHSAIYGSRRFDDFSDGVLTKLLGNSLDTFGRRLQQARAFEEKMDKLKKRFETPAHVFKHLNFDIEDTNATWRKNVPGLMKQVVQLATVQDAAKTYDAKYRSGASTCQKP